MTVKASTNPYHNPNHMWDDYNLPHAQSHSLYVAYEFTAINWGYQDRLP